MLLSLGLIILVFVAPIFAEVYPEVPTNSILKPYQKDSNIPITCIQREIDNGEHKFDVNGNIVYAPFPLCAETGESLALKYGRDGEFNCTVKLTDELYHLFQLYIHQDSPFSCKIPISPNSQVYVPFTLNFRGVLETSHLDIDTFLNIIVHKDGNDNIVSSIAYGSGGNSTRFIIGDSIPMNFKVNWVDSIDSDNKYRLHFGFSLRSLVISGLIGGSISSLITYVVLYGRFNRKLYKEGYKSFSTESALSDKRD